MHSVAQYKALRANEEKIFLLLSFLYKQSKNPPIMWSGDCSLLMSQNKRRLCGERVLGFICFKEILGNVIVGNSVVMIDEAFKLIDVFRAFS